MRILVLQISILLLSLFSYRAIAADAVVSDFKAHAQVIPAALINKGIHQVGRLNLDLVIQAIQGKSVGVRSVSWIHRDQPSVASLGSARSTAQWFRRGNCGTPGACRIEVNSAMWPKVSAAAKSVIGLHEYLGILRFNDANYELSTSLWVLSRSGVERSLEREEIETLTLGASQVASSGSGGGGITGVGGGGDFASVTNHLALLDTYLARLKKISERSARQKAFQQLLRSFSATDEVNWQKDGDTKSEVMYGDPESVALMQKIKTCRSLFGVSKEKLRAIYNSTRWGGNVPRVDFDTMYGGCADALKNTR